MIGSSFFYRSFCEYEYRLCDLVNRISEMCRSRSISGKHICSTEPQKKLHKKPLESQFERFFLWVVASHILQLSICTNREDIWRWTIADSSIISRNLWENHSCLGKCCRLWMTWEIGRGQPEWILDLSLDINRNTRGCHTEWDMSVLISIEIFWEYYVFFFVQNNTPRMRIALEEIYLIIGDLTIFAEHIPIRYEEC